MSNEVHFTPVETGDLSDIPPDAPEGEWTATCELKKASTSKDGYPMLILNWKLDEALTEGNEDSAGNCRASDFLVFFPANHAGSKMSKQKLKEICENLQIEVPNTTSIKDWEDIGDFTAALDGAKTRVWTKHKTDKSSGEVRTNVLYVAPRGFGGGAMAEEEKPAPKKNGAKKPEAKKANGRR